MADLRGVYFSGCVASGQFDVRPGSAEVQVLNDAYRLAGVTCGEDPIRMIQTHGAPGPIGRISAVFGDIRAIYSRYAHLPNAGPHTLRGPTAEWPRCSDCAQPSHGQKLVILGWHIALLDVEATPHRANGLLRDHTAWG